MPEENQRITREHLPGLLLARAIWERGPSLYFPPALKTATDQARACSLEMKTHCVELYRDAPELHEVVLASEALAACAARDARIVELESGQSADMFLTLTGEITQLRAELAAIKAQEPVAFVHPEQLKGLSAESSATCAVWNKPGAMPSGTSLRVPLYAAPVSEAKAQVVFPERKTKTDYGVYIDEFADEAAAIYNAALDEVARLNAAPVQQASVPDGWKWVPVDPAPGMIDAALRSEDASFDPRSIVIADYRAMLAAAPAAPSADAGALADAFLSWKLPDSVRPDGCAMDPTYPHRYGTNLMTWAQAKEMFEYVLAAHRSKGGV